MGSGYNAAFYKGKIARTTLAVTSSLFCISSEIHFNCFQNADNDLFRIKFIGATQLRDRDSPTMRVNII